MTIPDDLIRLVTAATLTGMSVNAVQGAILRGRVQEWRIDTYPFVSRSAFQAYAAETEVMRDRRRSGCAAWRERRLATN